MHDFKTWYRSLTAQEKDAYAERAGTTRRYIEVQLVFRRRNPSLEMIKRLADASLGRLSHDDVARFFLAKEVAA